MSQDLASCWAPCLGRRFAGGGIEPLGADSDDELIRLFMTFEPDDVGRQLLAAQTETDWGLACEVTRLPAATPSFHRAADHPLLKGALGRRHDAAVWFADNDHVKAVRLAFEGAAFALGMGHYEWDETAKSPRFDGFWGDDLMLWAPEEFDALLQEYPLKIAWEQSHAA